MKLPIRKLGRARTVPVKVSRMPVVQPVHGRHCACHRCER